MDSKAGSQRSLAKAGRGRGRGLMLRANSKKSGSESGIGNSINADSTELTRKSDGRSSASLQSPVYITEDSQVGTDTGNESMQTSSRPESCAHEDIGGQFIDAVHDLQKALPTLSVKQESNLSTFSNTNCLHFSNNPEVQKFCYRVEFVTADDHVLFPIDKEGLFLKNSMKNALRLQAYCFRLPDKLYTTGQISKAQKEIQETIHSRPVTLKFMLIQEPFDNKEFFDTLLRRVAVMIPPKQDFVPLRLTPENRRFERFPGEVIDVLPQEELSKITLRCSPNPTSPGTVRDVISECLLYSMTEGVDKEFYHRSVFESLKDLVVLADIEKTTMVINDIIWDQDVSEDAYRLRHFKLLGVNIQPRPVLVCKHLNKETTTHMEAENLRVQGSRRIGGSHSAARGHTEGGADRVSQFLGDPVSGQQRQLALFRYLESTRHERIKHELEMWGLQLLDTAVISNGVVLQTDQMLRLGKDNYAPVESQGWISRLSNLQVNTPIHISTWAVVARRGDENTVTTMIEILINDAPQLGIEMKEATTVKYIQSDERTAYVGALKAIQEKHANLQLAIVIMRASRDDIYRDVKRWALMSQNRNIATQVLIRDTARAIASRLDLSLSIITQINCKMGGDLWTLDGALTGIMVIGMSSYTGVSGESWVGVVASKNRLFSRWYSSALKDMRDLKPTMAKALAKYIQENKEEPQTTVVFRRRMAPLSEEEKCDIRAACGTNTALVVVSLLDAVELADMFTSAANLENCIEELKKLHKRLIYIPHRKGVPTDALAFLLECNTGNRSTAEITKVANQLKHMYFNVAGETPLPAPLLYADKCAEFVADVLEERPEERFEDLLYYL